MRRVSAHAYNARRRRCGHKHRGAHGREADESVHRGCAARRIGDRPRRAPSRGGVTRCYAVLRGVTRCYRRAISAGVWCGRCQSSVEGATRRPAPSRSGALLPCCIHTELCRKLINYLGGSVIGHASEVQSPSARSSHRGAKRRENRRERCARRAEARMAARRYGPCGSCSRHAARSHAPRWLNWMATFRVPPATIWPRHCERALASQPSSTLGSTMHTMFYLGLG